MTLWPMRWTGIEGRGKVRINFITGQGSAHAWASADFADGGRYYFAKPVVVLHRPFNFYGFVSALKKWNILRNEVSQLVVMVRHGGFPLARNEFSLLVLSNKPKECFVWDGNDRYGVLGVQSGFHLAMILKADIQDSVEFGLWGLGYRHPYINIYEVAIGTFQERASKLVGINRCFRSFLSSFHLIEIDQKQAQSDERDDNLRYRRRWFPPWVALTGLISACIGWYRLRFERRR